MCVDPANCNGQCPECHQRDEWPYIYFWNRPDREQNNRKSHLCKVTARGTKNSIRVEFIDGFQMITSGNSIRRVDNLK